MVKKNGPFISIVKSGPFIFRLVFRKTLCSY
jgi:hypothetical protein